MLVPDHYLKPCHNSLWLLQHLRPDHSTVSGHYLKHQATVWDRAHIYHFCASIQLLFETRPVPIWHPAINCNFCASTLLVFVCDLATVYNLWLLCDTWVIFTAVSYCLIPGYYLQFVATVWDPASIYNFWLLCVTPSHYLQFLATNWD
jgi:hypothetical protein